MDALRELKTAYTEIWTASVCLVAANRGRGCTCGVLKKVSLPVPLDKSNLTPNTGLYGRVGLGRNDGTLHDWVTGADP